ncbi:MAG: hypothetical protein AAFP19_00075 [Bacteroidota bacterium]
MEFIKSNALILNLLANLFFVGLPISQSPMPCTQTPVQRLVANTSATGSIVMEDDIMHINTHNSEDPVVKIELYTSSHQLIIDANGCFAPICQVDLSHLAKGQYKVLVMTAFGNSFSETISLTK